MVNGASRKRGRKPKPADERRRHSVTARLTDDELALVDSRRGAVSRGEWIRRSALGRPPQVIPEINREAWQELARSAANLNQIAYQLNTKDAVYAHEIRAALDEFRARLIGIDSQGGGDEGES